MQQWECKSDMDNAFRFGEISVTCEGYDYPDDPYILKGSCGVSSVYCWIIVSWLLSPVLIFIFVVLIDLIVLFIDLCNGMVMISYPILALESR